MPTKSHSSINDCICSSLVVGKLDIFAPVGYFLAGDAAVVQADAEFQLLKLRRLAQSVERSCGTTPDTKQTRAHFAGERISTRFRCVTVSASASAIVSEHQVRRRSSRVRFERSKSTQFRHC